MPDADLNALAEVSNYGPAALLAATTTANEKDQADD